VIVPGKDVRPAKQTKEQKALNCIASVKYLFKAQSLYYLLNYMTRLKVYHAWTSNSCA